MKRLLVVEDDQAIRDVLQEILTYEGYTVTVAATTDGGIRALQVQAHDLVLTDGMEFQPPYEAAQRQGLEALQRAAAGRPVVLFTAYAEAARLNPAKHHLARVWFKPMDLVELLASIEEVLHLPLAALPA